MNLSQTKAPIDYKAKDVELWKRWNLTKNSADLQALLDQLSPLIAREVNRWACQYPGPCLRLKPAA
jgi:hypothetical protein